MRFAAVICGTLLLSACARPTAAPDPHAPFKLECRNEGQPLIYILDPKTRTVTMANMAMQPKGIYTASAYEYYIRFKGTNQMHANEARVNRYDGRMTREFGEPPFLTDEIFGKPGNVLQSWQCKRSEAKPIL
jgi:hypothetical protein